MKIRVTTMLRVCTHKEPKTLFYGLQFVFDFLVHCPPKADVHELRQQSFRDTSKLLVLKVFRLPSNEICYEEAPECNRGNEMHGLLSPDIPLICSWERVNAHIGDGEAFFCKMQLQRY